MRSRNLGKMRHRLTIKAIVRTEDEGGGFARADVDLAVIWARIAIVGKLEANTYSQLQERVTHKALIRWRDDIRQGQTVVWKRTGRADLPLYVVTSVDADPDKRPGEFMELILREGGNL
jgi:SPP1 family predicted phage head-tail adaptor